MKEEVILKLVQIQNQFRFLHWQTTGDAKHRAYGGIYETLDDLMDTFAEACMGKHGRFEFENEFAIMFQDIKSISVQEFVDGITEFLISFNEIFDNKYDSDLLNLRDEMLAEINKLKYLLTLKY
jgi:DNA-binding ferritin-like protein